MSPRGTEPRPPRSAIMYRRGTTPVPRRADASASASARGDAALAALQFAQRASTSASARARAATLPHARRPRSRATASRSRSERGAAHPLLVGVGAARRAVRGGRGRRAAARLPALFELGIRIEVGALITELHAIMARAVLKGVSGLWGARRRAPLVDA